MTQTTPPAHAHPSGSVASMILQRRVDRQRFDSADFAMAQQHKNHTPPTVPASVQLDSSDDFSDWVQCEFEPEPESPPTSATVAAPANTTVVPPQKVPRIRLQRFDSADWAMQQHQAKQDQATSDASSVEPTLQGTVAKLRLERHAFATCSFVTTPIDPPAQHFVKNA